MDIKELILKQIDKNGEVRSAEIVKATGFSRVYINRSFQELREKGKIILVGKANNARYIAATQRAFEEARTRTKEYRRFLINRDLNEDEVLNDLKRTTALLDGLEKNVGRIVSYSFLEMLNNAIEHSGSPRIEVIMQNDGKQVFFEIVDQGIGIFENIIRKFHMQTKEEAIRELLKGRLTTSAVSHSGEGIFFTSRAADNFVIVSSDKKLIFNNIIRDRFIKTARLIKGTRVSFSIELNSKRVLDEIFKRYTDDSFEFKRTEVRVRLYQMGIEFLSRSQARRIVSGLEKFSQVILDFKGVQTIGQGFADEIFRVWRRDNPQTKIEYENAGPDVVFMIKHAAG
jgi:anti-sigma regulatory factor (Ser/Thr protein kinase)